MQNVLQDRIVGVCLKIAVLIEQAEKGHSYEDPRMIST